MRCQLGVLAILFVAWSGVVQAGPCDAHYRFEGDLSDSGGQGYNGQMIAKGGVPATPQFVDSPTGRALKLDGKAAMRAMLDTSPDLCSAMTVIAWIKIEPLPSQAIISNNGGNHLLASGPYFSLRTTGRDLKSSKAIFANAPWMFVAATWDNEARSYRLHWNGRHAEAGFEDRNPKPGDPAIWVGALNDKLHSPAKDILVDDLRLIGRSLTIPEVNELRAAGPGGPTTAAAIPSSAASESGTAESTTVAAGAACSVHGECGAGMYCAVDGTCHPEDHLPVPVSSGSGRTIEDMQDAMADQYGDIGGDVDSNQPPDLTPPDSGRTIEDMQDAMADQYGDIGGDVDSNQPPDLTPPDSGRTIEDMQDAMADQYGDIGGDVESNPLPLPTGGQQSGDESTDGESGGSSEPAGRFGGTLDGKGSTSLGDYLGQVSMPTASSGDTLECKSPVQRLSDLATGFRDALVEIAHSVACGMAERPIASLGVAAGVEDPSVYETREFQSKVVNELIEACRTATPDIVYLPDAMLDFWNDQIANNNWSTIGPRSLVFGAPESGNIISPGDRMFISTSPWIDNVDPHVTIEEFSGRARMQVTICATNAFTGHSAIMRRFVINDTQDERRDEKETILHIISANLSYITVFLDGRSTPDRHFRYKLIVDK